MYKIILDNASFNIVFLTVYIRYLGNGFPSTKNQSTHASICLTELGRSKILRFASNKNIVGVPKT